MWWGKMLGACKPHKTGEKDLNLFPILHLTNLSVMEIDVLAAGVRSG